MTNEKHNHREAPEAKVAFSGYAPPTSSTTYTPNQFFDVVLPHASRGCLRLVAFLIRKTLGWSDEHGNPQNPEATVSFRELVEEAGIGRGRIKEAIQEATERKFINCLRFGQPHRAGEEGFSALYSLRWADEEEYITDPERFDGFFAGNGNLTHIPNEFFDLTIPHEPLALVKVVGVIIRHTIGFQVKYGFRRQQVEMSFSEIMRRAGIASRSTVNIALKEALEKNHIRKVSEGYFDPNAGLESTATTYGIKWIDQSDQVPKKAVIESDFANGSKIEPGHRFRNRTGESETVPKSNRRIGSEIEPGDGPIIAPETVPKSNREGFQNRTDIKTTKLNNLPKQQQQSGEPVVAEGGILPSALILMEAGFDRDTAHALATQFSHETIQSQVEWLPQRKTTRNRLGLLRKSIEEDWAAPETSVQTSEQSSDGFLFGAHFYAALATRSGVPTVAPSDSEARQAEAYLSQVSRTLASKIDPVETGRMFGEFVRKNQDEKRGKVLTLALAIRAFGEPFVSRLETEMRSRRKAKLDAARDAHHARFTLQFEKFMSERVVSLQSSEPELVATFEEQTRVRIARMKGMSAKVTEAFTKRYEDPVERVKVFEEFLTKERPELVLDFWTWDANHNPTPFKPEEVAV